MIVHCQLFSRTLVSIRFSLEFLGVLSDIELNSTVSDFSIVENPMKTKTNIVSLLRSIGVMIELALLVSFEGPLLVHS